MRRVFSLVIAAGGAASVQGSPPGSLIVDAHSAQRKKERNFAATLAWLKSQTEGHALAGWVAYWELTHRLGQAEHHANGDS